MKSLRLYNQQGQIMMVGQMCERVRLTFSRSVRRLNRIHPILVYAAYDLSPVVTTLKMHTSSRPYRQRDRLRTHR